MPRHGVWGVVYAVRGVAGPAVLRLSWPDDGGQLARAVRALTLWNGQGAACLLRADLGRHALLLERLDAGKNLETLEIGAGLRAAGELLRRLAVPAPDDLPTLDEVARRDAEGLVDVWERLGRPIPQEVIGRSLALSAALRPVTGRLLVNWDLHWGNVLWGRGGWQAIDPQVLAGELEDAVAPLLWWRLEDIEAAGGVPWALGVLEAAARLDPVRLRAWVYVRTVGYWLWGLEAGLTLDPPRCERVIAALDWCAG